MAARGRHIVVAIPSYSGTVHIGTMRSLMHDVVAMMRRGDVVSVSDESCNTELAVARALTVARFLRMDGATHLVMVDNDVMWSKGGILRLVDHDEDCVAGVYPQRKDPIAFPLRWLDEQPNSYRQHPSKGLIEVGGVAAGFLCCTRAMLEAMVKEYASTRFVRDGEEAFDLFDRVMIGDRRLSEDYSFCERWRRMGGSVWVDPAIHMGHVGLKVFAGSLGEWSDGDRA
jgi:hypothetical protein